MYSTEKTSRTVDTWIVEEELPSRANLKVIRTDDPDYGLTEDEIADRSEFIRCYLLRHFEPLLLIPNQPADQDFFIANCDVLSPEYSAFYTHDFQKSLRPFNKYGYAMRKIMERVKDLAIMHSSISSSEGRFNTLRRYEALVDREFRERLLALVERFKRTKNEEWKFELRREISKLNRRILECKKIWERYSPPDVWDH